MNTLVTEATGFIDNRMCTCDLRQRRGNVRARPFGRFKMKFSLLLFVLAQKLKAAAKKNPAYRKHLGIMQIRVLIRTADGKRGRLFVFNRGAVSSLGGADHPCDVALVWADTGTAFRVMTSKTGDADTFRAAAEGKVRVEGMVPYLQWFTDGVKLVMG